MSQIILFNKPFRVMSQFTDDQGRKTLKEYMPDAHGFYPAGRLDYDSEGLMLLTDDGKVQHRIANPAQKLPKTYWVEIENIADENDLDRLREGISLKDGPTRPAKVKKIAAPNVWPRNPPVRERQNIPTEWLEITITEGRNRQVRRMTAAIGHPTLRLIRSAIGPWKLNELSPGEFRQEAVNLPAEKSSPRSNKSSGNYNKRKQRHSRHKTNTNRQKR